MSDEGQDRALVAQSSFRNTQELTSRAGYDQDVSVRSTAAVLAQNVQITGGSFTSAGRDIHNHIHIHEAAKVDLKSVLEPIDNHRRIQQDTLSKATPRTGEWIFEYQPFPMWREPGSDVKVIWGFGDPGAGKTVLTSIVIDTITKWAEAAGSAICIGYFYIRYTDGEGLAVREILEVFVKQAVEKHTECFQLAEKVYAEHIRFKTRPTEAELLNLLQLFANMSTTTFYFIDALDETSLQTQFDLVKKLSSLNNVKLFLTSRPSTLLRNQFPDARHFTISAQASDIELHISNEIDRSPEISKVLKGGDPKWLAEIVSSVKAKCNGMFLHAALQMDALRECTSLEEIHETLRTFPAKLEGAYGLTWGRIMNQTQKKSSMAQICLLLVLSAGKSVTVEELRHVMATSPENHKFEHNKLVDKDTLVGICRGLLVVDEETQIVRLVHYTAKETLNRLILEASPHLPLRLASLCVASLAEHGFQRWDSRSLADALKVDPLLPYAYLSWSTHARNSLHDPPTAAQIENFVKGCQAFPIPTGTWSADLLGPLHVAAYFNLPIRFAGSTHLNAIAPNTRTKEGDTPLCLACQRKSHSAIRELLALLFIDVNATDSEGATPLIIAARLGDEEATKLLLHHRDIKLELADEDGFTALIWASKMGHEGVVKLLMDASRPEMYSMGNDGRTPLVWAASIGNSAIVQHLLDKSPAEVHVVDDEGLSPLHWASREGRADTVRVLLDASREEIGLRDRRGRTPLVLASAGGHEGVVKALLGASLAEVDLADDAGLTPLMWAAKEGHEGVVEVLLTAFLEGVHSTDIHGRTPLIWASTTGKTTVVQTLLAVSSAEVHVADNKGRTPLIWASKGGHEDIVKLLLATSQEELSRTDSDGRTPLLWAVTEGHEAIVKLLLAAAETDVHVVDRDGRTLLSWAACKNREGIVKLLLSASRDEVQLADNNGWPPLSHAARTPGNAEIVKLLLPLSQPVVNLADTQGRTPLILAAMQNRTYGNMGQFSNDPVATTSALFENPQTDVNLVDQEGSTALIWACKQGHPRTVKRLLDHPSTNVNLADSGGRTALGWASKNGHKYIVDLLRGHPDIELSLGRRMGRRLDSAVHSVSSLWKR